MSDSTHARERRLIDRHFESKATPRTEAVLRGHLAGCADCRKYYDRHLLLGRLDPRAPEAVDRLAAGLGFASPPRRPWAPWPALGLVAATAGLLIVALSRPAADRAFTARGSMNAAAPALEVYRSSGGTTRPAGGQVAPGDELAFAYRNPTGHTRLVVVGIDEQAHIYWYHPDPDVTAAAIPIGRGPEGSELPEAIRHDYQGRSLRILGVFGDESLSTASVRRWLDASGCEGLRARLATAACVTVALDVRESGP